MIMHNQVAASKKSIQSWTLLGALVVGPWILVSGCDMTRERSLAPTPDRRRQIETAEEAVFLATKLFGTAEAEPARVSADLMRFEGGRLPFLDDQIAGRIVWKVTLRGVKLNLEAAAPGFEDTLERTFDVFIDPEDGTLVEISSRWPEGTPPIEPEPSSEYATAIVQESGGEEFHAFPSSPPSISFLGALNTVLRDGFGSPIQARQIIADYVMRSHMGNGPEPVWSITLRGIESTWPGGPPGIPPRLMNRIRNVVQAENGKWLGATTRPSTDLGPRLQATPPGDIPDPPVVSLGLSSPSDGTVVSPGRLVEWTVTATVSAGVNLGLAMVVVDLLQDASNSQLINIPPGNRPTDLADFDRPNGISNPAPDGYGSAYGGTQSGTPGAKNLVQIGGAQNTFGAVGDGIGLDTVVDEGVGQGPGGQVIVTGAFLAPCTPGDYIFSIDSGLANVLELEQNQVQFSLVRSADVLYS